MLHSESIKSKNIAGRLSRKLSETTYWVALNEVLTQMVSRGAAKRSSWLSEISSSTQYQKPFYENFRNLVAWSYYFGHVRVWVAVLASLTCCFGIVYFYCTNMCKDKFHELNESINDYASINDACGYSEAQVHSQCNKAIVEGQLLHGRAMCGPWIDWWSTTRLQQ